MNLSIATASCFAVRYVEYIIVVEVKVIMETKSIILELRDKAGLSQDELAEKVYVTRQAVSRCITLGEWRNDTKHRNLEVIIKTV